MMYYITLYLPIESTTVRGTTVLSTPPCYALRSGWGHRVNVRSEQQGEATFHHECTQASLMTPTHTAYTAHACAAAAARATAKAMRKYAHKRAIRSALATLVQNQPQLVATPF